MLFWAGMGAFGFSIGLIWYNNSRAKQKRNFRLQNIQKKIEANKKAKDNLIE